MVFMVGLHLFLDGDDYRERFQLIRNPSDHRSTGVSERCRRYRAADCSSAQRTRHCRPNQEFREIGGLLPIRRFTHCRPDGMTVTDGTSENAQRRRLDDERIGIARPGRRRTSTAFPAFDGEAGGIGMAFSIRRRPAAGLRVAVLEENLLISSRKRGFRALRSKWSSAAQEMLYRFEPCRRLWRAADRRALQLAALRLRRRRCTR